MRSGPSRRDFITTLGAGFGATWLTGCWSATSRSPTLRGPWGSAVADPNIVQHRISFSSGPDTVPALLAYPAPRGLYPAVLVIHASWLVEPYVAETVAMLAQAGFVGLAVDLFHFFPNVASWEEARRVQGPDITRLIDAEFREPRMVRNLQSGIDYLRAQPFTAPGGVGVIGFCGGGWNALLFGAQSNDVGAIVAFYAPVGAANIQHRAPLALASYIRVPVQYHGAATDANVRAADVDRLQATLEDQGTPFERYTYSADHGFFAYDRTGSFNAAAATLAWERTRVFLHRYAGRPVSAHPLAPASSRDAPGRDWKRTMGDHLALHVH